MKQTKEVESKMKKPCDSDIMKKFDNIKILMDSMKSRMFIHEFIGVQNKETYDKDINYDLIYS